MKRQHGFTLIELMIVLIVMMGVTAMLAKRSIEGIDRNRAQALGIKIAEYANAVGSYVFAGGLALPNQNHTGVNFLWSAADCPGGTGTQTHIGCTFPATLDFTVSPSVAIVNSGTQVTATITFSPVRSAGQPDVALAGIATQKAMAELATFPGGVQSVNINRTTAEITVTVTSVPVASPWLPRDGSQPMTGNLNMAGNHITGVGDINMADGRSLTKAFDMIGTQRIVMSGTVVPKPLCQPGMTPAIWVSPVFASANQATPMGAIQAFATDGGGNWTVWVRVIRNNVPIQSTSVYRRALVRTNCI